VAFACHAPTDQVPSDAAAPSKADVVAADLRSIETATLLYHAELRKLPGSWSDLVDAKPPFIVGVPLDPWGNEYFIESFADSKQLTVGSYGRDNQPGGEGEDADIERVIRVGQRLY
jgi:general secretion pathway protein G